MRLPRKLKKKLKKQGNWVYALIMMGKAARRAEKSLRNVSDSIKRLQNK